MASERLWDLFLNSTFPKNEVELIEITYRKKVAFQKYENFYQYQLINAETGDDITKKMERSFMSKYLKNRQKR